MEIGARPAVLVVEDEESLRELIVEVIEPDGYDVLLAESVEGALREFTRAPNVGLVLTDLNLQRREDGLELARQVKDMRPDTQVVLLTGDRADTQGEALEQGVIDQVVAKPFPILDLLEIVRLHCVPRR